ncbi:MAG: D-glycero-beta-D-manno-heptose 1-phosphate adenylyltransferase [Candidatus Dormibacteria bacterium]
MTRGTVVVVGDTMLDRDLDGRVERLSPEAPVPIVDEPVERSRPGGAGLAAQLAVAGGRRVVLVTALGGATGEEVQSLLGAAGVAVHDLGLAGPTPEKIRIRTDGRSLLRVDRGNVRSLPGAPDREMEDALRGADAVLVSDYGRGVAAEPGIRRLLAAAVTTVPGVWDPHPRGEVPVAGMRLVTPNRAEAMRLAETSSGDLEALTMLGARLRSRWSAAGIAITMGSAGALLIDPAGGARLFPAAVVHAADSCGAGDQFASAVTLALAEGMELPEAVATAVAQASAFVAAGGAGGLHSRAQGAPVEKDGVALAQRVRAAGGTVVAAGGCFDLLHAGHVGLLRAARALGDCLIVLLNSDESARRLKGPGRPLVSASDRAAVLGALACVDAVEVFEEDTPEQILRRVRPHVWVKGGDYTVAGLPEAAALSGWGGQAVTLPHLPGRSTTQLLERVAHQESP